MKTVKFLLTALFVTVLLCATVNAAEIANIPESKVTLNGTEIDNGTREYPLLLYKNITYFPLTYYDCRYLGLVTEWSDSTKTLSVKKENITGAYREYKTDKTNDISNEAVICPFNVYVNGKRIDNTTEEYPFIMFRGVTYFPLTWRFAAEEFGWDYNYSHENGLVINSTNRIMEKPALPEMRKNNPSAALHNGYYYYTATDNRVLRVPESDFSKTELVHTLEYTYYPDTTAVDFSVSEGKLYMGYRIGGATMGVSYRYRINDDGTLEKSNEGTHFQSGVGGNGYVIDGNGFTVERYNSGRAGTTSVFYKLDGEEEKIQIKKDGIIFGEYKEVSQNLNENGILLGTNPEGNVWFNEPQVIGNAIYLTGYEAEGNKNSDLYRVDVKTGNIEMVLENVKVFHTFYGWDNEKSAMSEMVLYEKQTNSNMLYRFSYLSKMMYYIQGNIPALKLAAGDTNITAVLDDGKMSYVWCYDGYGVGSLKAKVFESNKGFDFEVNNGMMIGTSYYSDDVKSLFLTDYYNFTKTCELPTNIFICENTVIMTIQDDSGDCFVVRMNMD